MIEIKTARLEDIPAMRQVAISSYRDTFSDSNSPENMEVFLKGAYALEKLIEEFNEPKSIIMLAWEGSQQVGFVRLRESTEVEAQLGNNTVELQRLYVLTAAQGKSVGRKLMEQALTYALEKKYDWLWLGVWERNFNAQQFYLRWGFEKFSEHTFMMGDDPQIDWLLRKKLTH